MYKNSKAVNYQKTRAGSYTLIKSLTLSDLKKSASIMFEGVLHIIPLNYKNLDF
jgi:hypothetical protein